MIKLPRFIRTTTFRLTLLFLALFAGAAAAFLGYIYVATAGEVSRRADNEITREMNSLEAAYRQGGVNALNTAIIERSASEKPGSTRNRRRSRQSTVRPCRATRLLAAWPLSSCLSPAPSSHFAARVCSSARGRRWNGGSWGSLSERP